MVNYHYLSYLELLLLNRIFIMIKSFELRIYPNTEQQKEIIKTFGVCRFVHNKIIAIKKELWEDYRLSFNPNLKSFKEEWNFIKEVSSQAVCSAYNDTLFAYKHFFINGKGYPKFKKKDEKQSYRIACTYDKKRNNRPDIKIIDQNHIIIPKLGKLKFKNYKNNDWNKIHIINATIKKSNTNKFYISLCCELSNLEYKEPKYYATAFDLGIKDYCIFDTGEVVYNPKYYIKSQNKLVKEQRKLSKCVKGSKGYNKQKYKVSKLHEKIKNQRKDFQHKLSSKIVNENQVIISEDLNIKGLLKNHNLAKHISDASWYSFLNMIKYKSNWNDRTYIKVNRFFPSSKLCNKCSYKYKELSLNERIWICPNCGEILYRDENAALNLLKEGLKIYKSTVEVTESDTIVSKPIDTGLDANLESEQFI